METLTTIIRKNEILSRAESSLYETIPIIIKLIKQSKFEGFFDLLAYIVE
jgi:hypothetical protein